MEARLANHGASLKKNLNICIDPCPFDKMLEIGGSSVSAIAPMMFPL
jgi:hypothetical protein